MPVPYGARPSFVALIEGLGERFTVTVDTEDELGEVVRANRDAIDPDIDELVEDDDVGRYFDHHPELEITSAHKATFGKQCLDTFEFRRRADERDHHIEVAIRLADLFDGIDFESEDVGLADIAARTPVANHRVLFV